MDTGIGKKPGIGPGTGVSSRPLDEDTALAGPSFWAQTGSHTDNDRASRFQTGGQYWQQQPAETSPGPGQGMEPSSDTTGSNPLPDAEMLGRQGGNLNAQGLPVRGADPAVDNC